MKILITGGLGYIGSHLVIELLNLNYKIDIIDDLSNSSNEIYKTIKYISRKECNLKLYNFNLNNHIKLDHLFKKNKYKLIIHTAISNSKDILKSYTNDLTNLLNLINIMEKYNTKNLIFSSTYKDDNIPFEQLKSKNKIKSMLEEILIDVAKINKNWKIIILRYLKPLGIHSSGLLFHKQYNFIYKILDQLLLQKNTNEQNIINIDIKNLHKIKDYIHIDDLIDAHICSIYNIFDQKKYSYFRIYDIGRGIGTNKLEFISILNKILKIKIKYNINNKYVHKKNILHRANIEQAKNELSWKPKKTIEDICYSYKNYLIQNQNDSLKKYILHHYTME